MMLKPADIDSAVNHYWQKIVVGTQKGAYKVAPIPSNMCDVDIIAKRHMKLDRQLAHAMPEIEWGYDICGGDA